MPKKGSKKRSRRSGEKVGDDVDPFASAMGPRDAVDLFVPMCKAASCGAATASPEPTLRTVLRRLYQAGYVQCAVTHTVYGRPRPDVDAAETAIPAALLQNSPLPVLRRLHVVVETLTDLALFSGHQASPIEPILNGYDIVSLSPRNAATWEAACRTVVHRNRRRGESGSSGGGVDIISIDYYSAAQQQQTQSLRIRHADIRQLAHNNMVLELPYAPALIDARARRHLMVLCSNRAVTESATRLLLSSGPRLIGTNQNVGPQALRRPGDLLNFARVVMGLSAQTVQRALDGSFLSSSSSSSSKSTTRPHVQVTDIEIVGGNDDSDAGGNDDDATGSLGNNRAKKKSRSEDPPEATLRRDKDSDSDSDVPPEHNDRCDSVDDGDEDDHDNDDDGFIAM
jgi:hypothetical protein